MAMPEDSSEHFDAGAYEQVSSEFVALQTHLPPAAVSNLARDVVTRLGRGRADRPGQDRAPAEADIGAFCHALISDDSRAGADCVTRFRDRGVSVEDLYQVYLSAAARRLGVWWDESKASFAEVTIGVSRIYAILRVLRDELIPAAITHRRTLAFASVPDEQHTLGVTMAADLFRSEGWDVDLLVGLSHNELLDRLERTQCSVIGLSASSRNAFATLAQLVVSLRICKPEASILISGNIVEADGDTIALTGADGMCWDVPTARSEVRRLLDTVRAPARAARRAM